MEDYDAARKSLIAELSCEIRGKRVLAAMSRVPREKFVPEAVRHMAYENHPLPIGQEQTISQPYIIGLMTEALELTGKEKVLEVGTGSGYQTAILAELAEKVVSVERLPELAEQAKTRLESLGYHNIEIHLAEETLGWKQGAPYNAIIVTASPPNIPQDLILQLAEGGRMVIPVGPRGAQELYKITKHGNEYYKDKLADCSFVALIGKNAWAN